MKTKLSKLKAWKVALGIPCMAFGIEGQADVVKMVAFPSGLYSAILLIDFQAVQKKINIILSKITGEHFERTFFYIRLIGIVRSKSNFQVSQIQ